jgi:Fe-S-cluster containining protein
MNIIFPPGFNFDCRCCGKCCKGWTIHIDEKSYHDLVETDFFKDFQASHEGIELFSVNKEESTVATARVESGFCIFLEERLLCTIHKKLGLHAKPLGCRQFPFRVKLTPDGVYVGLSFYCPSIQHNEGRPVSEYGAEIQSWLDEYPYKPIDTSALFLDEKLSIDWRGYRVIEDFVQSVIASHQDVEEALWIALVTLCQVVSELRSGGIGQIEADDLKRRVDDAMPMVPHRDEVFSQLALMYALTVVGVLESGTGEEARANTEAIMYGGTLKSQFFEKDIDMSGFTRYYAGNPLSWKPAFFSRYIEHLLFRKFLLGPEPVIFNMAALYVAYNLGDFYLYLSAYQSGKPSPDREDGLTALDVVEKGFASHTRVMVPFFSAFVEGFIMQLDALRKGEC